MIIGTAIVLAVLAQGVPPQAPAPQTDETVAVQRGTRLTVNNFAGRVLVHASDQNTVHLIARHQNRTTVHVRQTPGGLVLSASGEGPAGSVDYDITAPAWMPLKVEGTYCFITIEGTEAEVSAASVRGDISIKGGSGFIAAKSVEGSVVVEGAQGKLTVASVNEKIDITNAIGDITAGAINGTIRMEKISSKSVDASTVNGAITFQGAIADGGHYTFASHNGGVQLEIPEKSNATVSVRTYAGSFQSSFAALHLPKGSEMQRGRRVTMTMGNGSADVSVESFGGGIRIGEKR